MTAIEGRALRSEGNEPVPWSGLQTELLERMPGKKCERRAKHQDGIEAVRLCAFTPPGPSLDRHSVVVFPLTMVEWGNGADRASNHADVSIAPSKIPYSGFSPVRLQGQHVR